jgi:hypothetical protein
MDLRRRALAPIHEQQLLDYLGYNFRHILVEVDPLHGKFAICRLRGYANVPMDTAGIARKQDAKTGRVNPHKVLSKLVNYWERSHLSNAIKTARDELLACSRQLQILHCLALHMKLIVLLQNPGRFALSPFPPVKKRSEVQAISDYYRLCLRSRSCQLCALILDTDEILFKDLELEQVQLKAYCEKLRKNDDEELTRKVERMSSHLANMGVEDPFEFLSVREFLNSKFTHKVARSLHGSFAKTAERRLQKMLSALPKKRRATLKLYKKGKKSKPGQSQEPALFRRWFLIDSHSDWTPRPK